MSEVSRIKSLLINSATLQGNKFNKANQLVKLTYDGKLPALDGSALIGVAPTTGTEVSYVAQENVDSFDVVTSTGFKANSNTISHRSKIIGIAKATTLIGFSGVVVNQGKITNPSWAWTIGNRIFLNGTSLSTIAPSTGFLQSIGTATGADTIDVNIHPSILL